MTEYITKEQAIAVVKEAIANIVNSDSETVSLTDLEIEIEMTITDYTDAADVAPVMHARWEATKVGPMNAYACSNCGLVVIERNIPVLKYCHQCGARFDGEEE